MMAKGKKTGGKNIKPGTVLNPNGKCMPGPLRTAAHFTKKEALEKLIEFLRLPLEEVEKVLEDKKQHTLDHWVASICLLGIKHGDAQRLNFMFDRIIGKVTDKLEVSTAPKPTLITFSNGEQMLLGSAQEENE